MLPRLGATPAAGRRGAAVGKEGHGPAVTAAYTTYYSTVYLCAYAVYHLG
jgi:hypothetical protein